MTTCSQMPERFTIRVLSPLSKLILMRFPDEWLSVVRLMLKRMAREQVEPAFHYRRVA